MSLPSALSRPLIRLHQVVATVAQALQPPAQLLARWQVAHRQAADDRILWNAAMADARAIADIRQVMDAQPGLASR